MKKLLDAAPLAIFGWVIAILMVGGWTQIANAKEVNEKACWQSDLSYRVYTYKQIYYDVALAGEGSRTAVTGGDLTSDELYVTSRRSSASENITKFHRVPCPPQNASIGLNLGANPVLVLGGNLGGGWSRNTYSDFLTFDGSGAGGGVYGVARYYVQPGFFVGPEGGFMLLNINARNPDGAFGFVRTDAYLGGQAGVTLQGPGASKINLYTGLDANWSRITVGVEADERMSKILGGWSVHGGVEVQPIPSIPTMWLGLDLRHSDVSGTIGGDPTHVRWNMLTVTLSIQH